MTLEPRDRDGVKTATDSIWFWLICITAGASPEVINSLAPGACVVLVAGNTDAVWVTLKQYAPYVRHAWAGAWLNSFFRRAAGPYLASELIAAAVARTRARWPTPAAGIVTFIDAAAVTHKRDPGRCYKKAGWKHVGFTAGGLWVYQQLPRDMPAADFSDMHSLFSI